MHQEEVDLFGTDGEPILPDVAVLPVRVALELLVVWMDGKSTVIASENAARDVRERVVVARIRGEVDGMAEEILGGRIPRHVQTEQRMAEHRDGVPHEPFREDEREALGGEARAPLLVAAAGDARQTRLVHSETSYEPPAPGNEGALGGLAVPDVARGIEERLQGGMQLCARITRADGAQIEAGRGGPTA